MKEFFIITLIIFFLSLSTKAQDKSIPILKFEEFYPLLHQNNDTLYIINFWATWCRPCVAELPHFEKINKEYAVEKVKVILVSLDFAENIDSHLIPFIQKKEIQSDVLLLDESDWNGFIDKISNQWSGAIPATYIYKGTAINFYEKSFTYEELDTIVKQKLNRL